MPDDILMSHHVIVVGFARQGQALARWLPLVGARVTVTDNRDADTLHINQADYPGVDFVLGSHPETLLDDADVVCVSGGVPLSIPFLQAARERGIRLTNDAQLFVERCPAPIIGITGSAGKTTTTKLTGDMLRADGRTVWVGGNTGDVLLNVLGEIKRGDWVVMELSSFQLELMQSSPPIAAVLNITPNHLDRHGTMEAYTAAKATILAHQAPDDIAVLGYDDSGSYDLQEQVNGRLLWSSAESMVSHGAFLMGERLMLVGEANPAGSAQMICTRDDVPLRGEHNLKNVLAACTLAGAAGVPADVMAAAIRDFEGVPHRLEAVRTVDGVTYVNDSIATAPERTLAALRSYDEPLVLLLGGADKKLPWAEMLAVARRKSRQIIAFGGSAADAVMRGMRELGAEDEVIRVERWTTPLTRRSRWRKRAILCCYRRAGRATTPIRTSRRGVFTFENGQCAIMNKLRVKLR